MPSSEATGLPADRALERQLEINTQTARQVVVLAVVLFGFGSAQILLALFRVGSSGYYISGAATFGLAFMFIRLDIRRGWPPSLHEDWLTPASRSLKEVVRGVSPNAIPLQQLQIARVAFRPGKTAGAPDDFTLIFRAPGVRGVLYLDTQGEGPGGRVAYEVAKRLNQLGLLSEQPELGRWVAKRSEASSAEPPPGPPKVF